MIQDAINLLSAIVKNYEGINAIQINKNEFRLLGCEKDTNFNISFKNPFEMLEFIQDNFTEVD